jgi:hypothetical protein
MPQGIIARFPNSPAPIVLPHTTTGKDTDTGGGLKYKVLDNWSFVIMTMGIIAKFNMQHRAIADYTAASCAASAASFFLI